MALGAYSQLLRLKGDSSSADHYDDVNRQFIQYWMTNGSVRYCTHCIILLCIPSLSLSLLLSLSLSVFRLMITIDVNTIYQIPGR